MNIEGCVALVTRANRGLGRAYAKNRQKRRNANGWMGGHETRIKERSPRLTWLRP